MSTKTTKKATAQAKETKKEFNLQRAFTLWIYKGKKGGKYLSGTTEDGTKLTGFFNNEKQNPKEPDIKVYEKDDENNLSKEEYCSLWCNVSETTEKKYLSGKIDETRVVGFFNSKAEINGTTPYINVYFSEDEQEEEEQEQPKKATKQPTKKTQKKVEPEYEEMHSDDDLPF